MATTETTTLAARSRQPEGSRATRRLRRSGRVPGVLYGGDGDSLAFDVDARELRHALAASGAVLELEIDGGKPTPVVLKDEQRHPVRGETMHVDLIRVRLDQPIQATVVLDLQGFDDSPGSRQGGILEQVTREVTVEALPTSIPESVAHDVSGVEIGDTVTLAAVAPPAGVRLCDDPETVVATVTPPRLRVEAAEGVEEETAVVGGAEAATGAEAESAEASGAGE